MPVLRTTEHPAWDGAGARYLVAVAAAWAAESVTYPFDLTKTRLQIQSEVAAAKHGYKTESTGMVGTALGIARREGARALWAGLLPMCQRHAVYSGCRLVLYEHWKEHFKGADGKMSLAASSFGGLVAGAAAQLVASPADLVKVQLQAEGRRRRLGQPPKFKGCWDAYVRLYRESGIRGFWRGAVPNVQRAALVNMGDLAAYDYTKQLLVREAGLPEGPAAQGGAAAAAGLAAAVLATPADVVKTRLMNQPVGPDGRGTLYRGTVDCVRQSVANEGFRSLYRGFLPLWLRLGPWALVNWLAFEKIINLLGGHAF